MCTSDILGFATSRIKVTRIHVKFILFILRVQLQVLLDYRTNKVVFLSFLS